MKDSYIKSVQQAKEYFISMGCSHFHMAREYPQRYEEYKELNISKQMETCWRIEQFNEYFNSLLKDKSNRDLWSVHCSMAEIVKSVKDTKLPSKMLEAIEFLCDRIPYYDRVIVSETINGRSNRECRSGLIYLAYDLEHIDMAKRFIDLSLYYAAHIEQKSRNFMRCQDAINLCNEIKIELGL